MKANDPNKAGLGKVNFVELGPVKYLTIELKVEKTVPLAFITAMGLIKRVDYELHFLLEVENKPKYKAAIFECLRALKDPQADPENPDNWSWKWMIIQPETTTPESLLKAQKSLTVKRPHEKERWMLPKLEIITMGQCAQTVHKGSLEHKDKTMRFLNSEIDLKGYEFQPNQLHQEVYLNNPLNAKPETQRTILRFPVVPQKGRTGTPVQFVKAGETRAPGPPSVPSGKRKKQVAVEGTTPDATTSTPVSVKTTTPPLSTIPVPPVKPAIRKTALNTVTAPPPSPPTQKESDSDAEVIASLMIQLHETQGWSAQKISDFLNQPLDKTLEVLASGWSK